ncbi:MAG: hypothetical protein AB7O04_02865 [Hyphomonadaceae bacterium]
MPRTRTKDPSEVAALMGEAFAAAARQAVGRAVAAGIAPTGEAVKSALKPPREHAPKPQPKVVALAPRTSVPPPAAKPPTAKPAGKAPAQKPPAKKAVPKSAQKPAQKSTPKAAKKAAAKGARK